MTILAQDTFAGRTNSGTWNTASDGHTWTQLDGVGLILSVGSNEGKGHAGNHDTQMLLGSGTATNQEGLVRLALGQSGDSIGLILRCDATGANYYYSEIGNFGNDITIYKVVSSSKTNLNVFAAGFTISNGSFYWMRFQVISTTLKTKIWADGSSEPASWTGSVTDSAIASGQYGIFLNSFGSVDAQFDSYQANDTTSAMPLVTQAQAKFYVKANMQTRSEARFLVSLKLLSQARAKFLVRAKLLSAGEAKFYVRSSLQAQARAKFLTRAKLGTTARSKFITRLALTSLAWSQFLVNQVIAPPTHFISATWVTRDGNATWVTRDGKVTWKTRQ